MLKELIVRGLDIKTLHRLYFIVRSGLIMIYLKCENVFVSHISHFGFTQAHVFFTKIFYRR